MNLWKTLIFKDIEWEDPPRGYYLTKVKQKVLWEDKNTGATLALVKFPEGVADRTHSHPEANQTAIGLSGEIEMPPDKVTAPLRADMAIMIPKGEKHGATRFTKEGIVLFFWDGSPKPLIEE
jgi:quercetin dioxygenase-like cupin family protein